MERSGESAVSGSGLETVTRCTLNNPSDALLVPTPMSSGIFKLFHSGYLQVNSKLTYFYNRRNLLSTFICEGVMVLNESARLTYSSI